MSKRKAKTVRKSAKRSFVTVRIPGDIRILSMLNCGIHDAADLHDGFAEDPRVISGEGALGPGFHRESAKELRKLARSISECIHRK